MIDVVSLECVYVKELRRLLFLLNLADLRSEDSGSLSCKLGSQEARDFLNFTVQGVVMFYINSVSHDDI